MCRPTLNFTSNRVKILMHSNFFFAFVLMLQCSHGTLMHSNFFAFVLMLQCSHGTFTKYESWDSEIRYPNFCEFHLRKSLKIRVPLLLFRVKTRILPAFGNTDAFCHFQVNHVVLPSPGWIFVLFQTVHDTKPIFCCCLFVLFPMLIDIILLLIALALIRPRLWYILFVNFNFFKSHCTEWNKVNHITEFMWRFIIHSI